MDAEERIPENLLRETDALRRVARGILFEPALAEDAVQEAWLAALRSQKHEARSAGWLTETVRRIAQGLRRQEARRGTRERGAARREAQPSASDSASRVELLRSLLDALEALEEPYRTAVQLRLLDDLPPRAIAERLGIPVETARTRVKRGVEKLRARLDAQNAHRRGEFLAALVPLALPPGWKFGLGAYASSKAILGGMMSAQMKIVGAVALVLVCGVLWWHPWSAAQSGSPAAPSAAEPIAHAVEAQAAKPSAPPAELASPAAATASERRSAAVAGERWEVRGRATKDRTQPFPGAEIELEVVAGYDGEGETLAHETVRAADDGSFALALPRPATALRVRTHGKTAGYLSFHGEALILAGAEAPQALVVNFLTLDMQLVGRVLDQQGAPIRGATVSGPGRRTVESDAQGAFELQGSSAMSSAQIDAWAEGYSESRTSLNVRAAGRVEGIEIRLAPWFVLRGRVIGEAGQPIAGAKVRCFPLVHCETQSGIDGRFTLTGLPTQPTWLSLGVVAAGFSTLRRELREGSLPTEELELTLVRGVEVAGVVCDAEGRGLPGAQLYVGTSAHDVDTLNTVAGDEGRFVFRDVPRTAKILHAQRARLAPTDLEITLPEHGSPGALRIVLVEGRSLRGIAVDSNSEPIPDLHVDALQDGEYIEAAQARTAKDGRFQIEHLPAGGKLTLELYGKGFVREQRAFEPNAESELRIVMTRSAGIAGRVVDAASGVPVREFRVRILPGDLLPGEQPLGGYESSWTDEGREFRDADGRFDTQGEELAAGLLTGLEVRAPGYAPCFVPRVRTSVDPGAAPVEIRLSAGTTLRGRVLDKLLGTPIEGASVRRFRERDARGSWFPREAAASLETRTDARGEFLFEGLASEPLVLTLDASGFASARIGPIEMGAGETSRTIELESGSTLRGQLLDAEGHPLAHEPVQVAGSGGEMRGLHRFWKLETDEQGRFQLDDLMPATYSASREVRDGMVVAYDLTEQVAIMEAGTYSLELRPRGKGVLKGTIQVKGQPGGLVVVQASRNGSSSFRAAFAHDGQFTLEGLEPGHWQLSAYESGSPQNSRYGRAEVDVADGQPGNVLIELR